MVHLCSVISTLCQTWLCPLLSLCLSSPGVPGAPLIINLIFCILAIQKNCISPHSQQSSNEPLTAAPAPACSPAMQFCLKLADSGGPTSAHPVHFTLPWSRDKLRFCPSCVPIVVPSFPQEPCTCFSLPWAWIWEFCSRNESKQQKTPQKQCISLCKVPLSPCLCQDLLRFSL